MNKKYSQILIILVTAAAAIGLFLLFQNIFSKKDTHNNSTAKGSYAPAEFVSAARSATPAIVHIKTFFPAETITNPLHEFYGVPPIRQGPSRGSGSGVSISQDGYIVTNNHVVENASRIEVVFPDRRSFVAKLVGTDPSTDLALIKVEAGNLPSVKWGNSDNVQIGEWVLAIGYPFSLNTTVTAGIISAKGRSIGILDRPTAQGNEEAMGSPVESFIQTDAAINPGNSGGALVNATGEVIGINTAIASQTGSYAGYGFAIPSNLARKVIDDLRRFGEVRRGFLGVTFPAPATEDQYFRQMGVDPAAVKGVLITGVQKGSAAEEAGLKPGDVIQTIDGARVASSAEFSERIARHRPGDQVEIGYLRNNSQKKVKVRLKGEVSLTQADNSIQSLEEIHNRLGAGFAPLTDVQKQQYRVRWGVMVTDVRPGGIFDQVGVTRGTIIIMINGRRVNSPEDIDQVLTSAENSRIRVDAIAPDGSRLIFTFSLGA